MERLSEEDLVGAVIGFLNPKFKFTLTGDLLNELLDRKTALSVTQCSEILYAYSVLAKEDIDSEFVKSLLERVSLALALEQAEPSSEDVLYLLVAY